MVVVCLLPATGAVEAAEAYAALPRTTKGLNLLVSGILAPDRERMPFGFLLGGGIEFPAPYGIDLNLGMSFQRLHSTDGTVTVVSLIDATAAKQAPTAVFFGAGLGPVFAAGNVRVGARMFGGVEFLHQRAVPIQVGSELISGRLPRRIAPMIGTVFHERNGFRPRARWPRTAHACVRRIPVLQNDSSMKTSRDAFTAVMNAQKSARR